MKRKISMFAVTLCLTAAMLTGCGGNKNGTTTSPAPAASTDNATETQKTLRKRLQRRRVHPNHLLRKKPLMTAITQAMR